MLKFILASGNSHKAEEFAELFPSEKFLIEAAPEKLEVVEDGSSFEENAFKKAEAYYNKFKRPVLADDSGLVVEALPDELGIHSARFGGDGLNDKDRTLLLLEKLQNVEAPSRNAYFVCQLCFYCSPTEIFFFEGRVMGKIGTEYTGEHGFGYDPVFMPDLLENKQSLAENPVWKNENSHRAKAVIFATKFFNERDLQS